MEIFSFPRGEMDALIQAGYTEVHCATGDSFFARKNDNTKVHAKLTSPREARVLLEVSETSIKSHIPAFVETIPCDEYGLVLLITERVSGENLADAVLTPATCARVCRKLLALLREFHDLGYVHGDIHADNVMIRSDEELVLLDFATTYNTKTEKTRIFTPLYPPPEALKLCDGRYEVSEDYEVGLASDLWSLGLLIHSLLINDEDMPGVSSYMLWDAFFTPHAIMETYKPYSSHSDIPADLNNVLQRLLSWDVAVRCGN